MTYPEAIMAEIWSQQGKICLYSHIFSKKYQHVSQNVTNMVMQSNITPQTVVSKNELNENLYDSL